MLPHQLYDHVCSFAKPFLSHMGWDGDGDDASWLLPKTHKEQNVNTDNISPPSVTDLMILISGDDYLTCVSTFTEPLDQINKPTHAQVNLKCHQVAIV